MGWVDIGHIWFLVVNLSFISGTTLLEVSFFSTPAYSGHRANFKGQCQEWWCLCTSSFSYDTVHSIHSSRMQGLPSMPGIIFITKVHKKQAPSSCSRTDEGKKSEQWKYLRGIFLPSEGGRTHTKNPETYIHYEMSAKDFCNMRRHAKYKIGLLALCFLFPSSSALPFPTWLKFRGGGISRKKWTRLLSG